MLHSETTMSGLAAQVIAPDGGINVPGVLALRDDCEGFSLRWDDTANVTLDPDGQGCVEVLGERTHSMWACSVCGIPTGGKDRDCKWHPDASAFLKHIREKNGV